MEANKKLSPSLVNFFKEEERSIFRLCLYHDLISKCLRL